ncbi:hypothetical protein JOB18_003626 [Solea senegalensis]|uniref:KIAA1549 n=1 Tax=Solea senegalensis TaxID=28829 RepID=A0AAV6SXA8_SOLSE|nr:UPF0606 protein KIAA1549 isoform X1 [Solea senegalensis]KAG7521648.1 hypothetical protein JOB18_003626 [Solea senegalensis]
MAGLVSFVGLVLMVKAPMNIQGHHALLLGMTVLVTLIAADSPVADKLPLDSTHHPMGDDTSSTGSLPSGLPNAHYTTFEDLDPGALPSLSEPDYEATTAVMGSNPKFEVLANLSTAWKLARTDSAKQSSSTSPTLNSHSHISLTRSTLSTVRSATPQLHLNSELKAPKSTLTSFSMQQNVGSKQTQTVINSQPSQPIELPNLAFTDSPSDEPYSKVLDMNHFSPSRAPLQENKLTHDMNIPHSSEFLAPGYNVPHFSPHPTSHLSEPTEVTPEDFYPTKTMEVDWGSGDYLETMSVLDSDGNNYPLVTKVPSDSDDEEDYTETYDTSFPSRLGISPSSLHLHHIQSSLSLMTAYSSVVPLKSIHPSSFSSTIHYTLEPTATAHSDIPDASDIDWPDTVTIQPTDVLLPDMNSLEYYTIQLTKENNSSDAGAEHRGNITIVSITTTDTTPTSSSTDDAKPTEEESSSDLSGFEPYDEFTTVETPQLANVSEPLLDPSIVPSYFFDPTSSMWGGKVSTTDWSASALSVGLDSPALTEPLLPHVTPFLPDYVMSSSSLTDVHWFVTEPFEQSTIHTTPVLTATIDFSPVFTEPFINTTAETTDFTPQDSTFTTEQTQNITSNVTFGPPVLLGDQGVTEEGVDISATMTLIPTSSEADTVSALPSTPATTTSHQATTITATNEASTNISVISTTGEMTTTTTAAPPSRHFLCNVDGSAYLIKIGFPSGATVGHAKSQIRDILKMEFNKSVELQVVDPPPKFVFRVVSGPVVYTAISVVNTLRRSRRRFLYVSPNWTTPDRKYHVHTVLQFVPSHIDVRHCNFSGSIEKGLTMAFAEVRRRSKESTNFTVHIINITMAIPKYQEQRVLRQPVDITFTVRGSRGYLIGSEVSNALMKLTMVEFSYYMGFPVLQIAEPFHYPELNTSKLLRSSWVRTVLLGVLDQEVGERTFQANMERRVAMLLGEAKEPVKRVKRATTMGNSSVQVVSTNRLVGDDHPLEMLYFVEDLSGQRVPAVQTASLLNNLDVQRAAIILGYRVRGILAEPVEKVTTLPSNTENTNVWIIIGVVIPLLVVVIIISILYWKLCRTDKLEFQPDAMTSMQQQRQKLQAPTVKGFDFAKLHLGQQSKDEIMVIQETVPPGPGSLPMSIKDGFSPSENGDIPTPLTKTSASPTKASRGDRRRERISPSDVDSVVSDRSSEQESTEENLRAHATPSDNRQTRKVPINVLNGKNRIGPPPMNSAHEQLSSATIFDHVDRMTRATDASRRLPNKVQLIAMQPIPVPPLHSPPVNSKLSDTNQINKEIQVALRHKSEIEHHRNKIRLRAKRKGHYDFPAMDDGGPGDVKDQDRIYQKAQMQIDKILDPDAQMPPVFIESKKSGRGRRSPKQRMKEQLNGGVMDADKDHLITDDSDAAYRKCPGVNNVAYVSDPDQGPGSPHRSPSPTDDVFLGPTSSPPGHAPPPPPYMPPQPSIEEARQQMHSLLDDAFALVSPTSQSSTAGITLPGVNSNPPSSSPPGRGPRPWGPSYQPLGPFPSRFTELVMSPPSVQGLTPRQGLGSSYLPPGEAACLGDPFQPDSLYSSRSLYADELPSSTRPRPVGGTAGAQFHHLTQVGLSSRMNGYPAGGRPAPGQNGGIGWNHYHDDNFSRAEAEKEAFRDCPDYSSSHIFQMPRSGIREPTAPPAHLDPPVGGYMSAPPPLEISPPTPSSASLIKAIREELLRLSQKQAAMPSYHS